MYRLGFRLALKGGREALTRLMLTALAVAIGVTILLGVFADFHAFQKTSDRPSWESTNGKLISSVPGPTHGAELWNYSENIYKGQFIEQLEVGALGSNAPVPPGIPKLPGFGQFYASPALSKLLKTVPANELGNRFPGKQIGTIGEAGLSFPNELAIYDGLAPSQFASLSGTVEVTQIATAEQLQGTTNIYKDAFGIAGLAILFPLLILVNTATRLSATRREERYAAMRLVGATPHQINAIASVDAIIGSLIGAVLGCVVFTLIRPAVADISFSGVKFFSNYVTPGVWAYVGMIILVPIVAAIASLISLRRIQISPLGVSRKTAPKKPKAWGLIVLAIGCVLFVARAHNANGNKEGGPGLLPIGFLLIMVGIVLSGSWLTMQISQVLARFSVSASSLLAARRLADNPKRVFRTVSGLVLAVFIGSVVAVLIPALNYAQNPSGQTSLDNVLRVPYKEGPLDNGLPSSTARPLIRKMESYSGTVVVPIYTNPAFVSFMQQQVDAQSNGNTAQSGKAAVSINPNDPPPNDNIASCASLAQLSVLGTCPPGAKAVTFSADNVLSGDNPLFVYKSLPVVATTNPVSTEDVKNLSLAGMLIEAKNPNTLEQIRTYLTIFNATTPTALKAGSSSLTAWQMGEFEPETVGEVAQIRNNDDANVGRAVLAVVALTLITAGCSLAVSVGGSLVERKRSFTLLRVSGVSLRTLSATVMLEAILPLVVASIVATGIGLGVGVPAIKSLVSSVTAKNENIPVHPSVGYYITLIVGLGVSLGLIVITLPLLGRMTQPEDARFE